MDAMMETDNPIERIVVQFGDAQALARQIGRSNSTVGLNGYAVRADGVWMLNGWGYFSSGPG